MKTYCVKMYFYISADNKADAYNNANNIINYLADVDFSDDGVAVIELDNPEDITEAELSD